MPDTWFPAPVVLQVRDEVNTRFPKRDKASDGIVGDTSHAARPSEHNPCWLCTGRNRGIVRAIDIDIDDNDPTRDLRSELLRELIGDPRVWYIISNQVIYSRTNGWVPKRYTGTNGHFGHLHVSFLLEGCWDTRPFFGPVKPTRTKPAKLSVSKLHHEFARVVAGAAPRYSVDVQRWQRLLNERLGGEKIRADGIVGTKTLNKHKRLEGKQGLGRPRVPDAKIVHAANRGKYQLVA